MTASEARRNWFRLLDEVVAGEVVVIERSGARVQIRRESAEADPAELPAYGPVAGRTPRIAEMASWGWEWTGPGEDLAPRERG
ncbi:MAG TPA: hypothetical protein VM778_11435 [Gemmatimonadota bacterium]|nr:hypothetical protein [Gemmatimonadota bacterium]